METDYIEACIATCEHNMYESYNTTSMARAQLDALKAELASKAASPAPATERCGELIVPSIVCERRKGHAGKCYWIEPVDEPAPAPVSSAAPTLTPEEYYKKVAAAPSAVDVDDVAHKIVDGYVYAVSPTHREIMFREIRGIIRSAIQGAVK